MEEEEDKFSEGISGSMMDEEDGSFIDDGKSIY